MDYELMLKSFLDVCYKQTTAAFYERPTGDNFKALQDCMLAVQYIRQKKDLAIYATNLMEAKGMRVCDIMPAIVAEVMKINGKHLQVVP